MLSHALAVTAVTASVLLSGESPRIAIYGYYFHCVYLLLTAGACARLHASGNPALQALAQRLSRPPHPRQQSRPLVEEVSGKALNLLGYVGVLLVLFGFTFALVNVKDQELSTPAPVIFAELQWSLLVALIWWVQDLFDRRVVMCFDAPVTTNLGYNAQGAPVGAFTVLTGGIASALVASPWPCLVMLLLFKHLHELVADVRCPALAPPASGTPQARAAVAEG